MIKENIKKIFKELPSTVKLEAAVKSRAAEEILEAIDAGIKIIGENYIQDAEKIVSFIDRKAISVHFIGHLQKNKVKKAVKIFDMIETVDSFEIAFEIDKAAEGLNKVMPVLIEVNIASESQKFGIIPEKVEEVIKKIIKLKHIKINGLMTMGPLINDKEKLRQYFKETKDLFIKVKGLNLGNVRMEYLSMGMSDSYRLAIEEGANLIRLGTKIFGPRIKN